MNYSSFDDVLMLCIKAKPDECSQIYRSLDVGRAVIIF